MSKTAHMDVMLLDEYLLHRRVAKRDVVASLLRKRQAAAGSAGFYAGIELLGEKTPDLTLIALRLALAGKKADDDAVVRLRALCERSWAGGPDGAAAAEAYYAQVARGSDGTTG
jgi:hypothetical protein